MKHATGVLILILGSSAPVLALTFIGPPTTDMKAGQVAVGAQYGWSRNDLVVKGKDIDGTLVPDITVHNLRIQTVLGSAHLGVVSERFEVYGLLGAGNIQQTNFDFAYGGGFRLTANLDHPLSWGVTGQVVHQRQRENDVVEDVPLSMALDVWDFQLAAGPCWRSENLSLYGGPMLHFIAGSIDADVRQGDMSLKLISFNLEQKDWIGAYLGGEVVLAKHLAIGAEFQLTPGALGAGVALQWRF